MNTTAHAQCYDFLFILCFMQYYNSGLMQLERSGEGGRSKVINYYILFSSYAKQARYAVR